MLRNWIQNSSLLSLLAVGLLVCSLGFVSCTTKALPKLEIPAEKAETEVVNSIAQWLEQLYTEKKFNGGVLIARDGNPLLMKAYGYTNYLRKEKLSEQSAFRLASLSKQFTCAGIMVLKAKGQLTYEDLVKQHLPELSYAEATLSDLMHHTSGIPDQYMGLATKYQDDLGTELSIQEVVELMSKYGKEAKVPGFEMAYSNTGYVLLAAVIERVSGLSYEQFMQENLFQPLGMQDSRVWNLLSADTTFANKTEGLSLTRTSKRFQPTFLDGVAGDGAVFASLRDFLIWDQFWEGKSLLTKAQLRPALTAPVLNDGNASNYGFGWGINGSTFSHTGGWLAARTYIRRDTLSKTCLVVLDNGANNQLMDIAQQLSKQVQRLKPAGE